MNNQSPIAPAERPSDEADLSQLDMARREGDAYQRSLDQLIDHCLQTGPGGYTPSDFTAADLDQRELDKLLARLRGS